MKEQDLQKLLELAVSQEQYFLDLYYRELVFFWGSITVILGATIAGGMGAGSSIDYLLLLAGPILIVLIAHTLRESLYRTYRRFLEAIATRAKIELRMGLCDSEKEPLAYWGIKSDVKSENTSTVPELIVTTQQ